MATKNEESEHKIPVFTVIKNGAILKNIFIVDNNNNDTCPSSDPTGDQVLIIGRHPDCNVMLTHPSISRFHLKIISDPSSQTLSVIDLSSVHGTWVSERKIEPWDRVELHEGDSLRIGGSSRVYRLHWIPLSQAYDIETPYVSAVDELMEEEKEGDTAVEAYQDENSVPFGNEPVEEEEMKMTVEMEEKEEDKGNNSLSLEAREIQSLGLLGEDLSCVLSKEDLEIAMKKEIPSAPPVPKNPVYSLFDENEGGAEIPWKAVSEEKEISSHYDDRHFRSEMENLTFEGVGLDNELSGYDIDAQSPEPSFFSEVCERESSRKLENQCPIQDDILCCNQSLESSPVAEVIHERESSKISCGELENPSTVKDGIGLTEKSFLLVGDLVAEFEALKGTNEITVSTEGEACERDLTKVSSRKLENRCPFQGDFFCCNQSLEPIHERESPNISCGELENPSTVKDGIGLTEKSFLLVGDLVAEFEALKETKEIRVSTADDELRDVSIVENVNSSLPAENVIPETEEDRENQTPQSRYVAEGTAQPGTIKNSPMKSDNRPSFGSIWLRRGKPANAIQLQTGKSRAETTLDGVDSEDGNHNQQNMEYKSILNEVISGLTGEKDEVFTLDKENFTPNTFLVKSLNRNGKLVNSDEIKPNQDCAEDAFILKVNRSSLDGHEDEIFTPDKENFTPNPLLPKSLRRKGVLEEIKVDKPSRQSPLKFSCSPSTNHEENFEASFENENRASRVIRELKPHTSGNKARLERELLVNKKRPERVPFQSLAEKSDKNSSARTTHTVDKKKISNASFNSVQQSKRAWTMVADTSTLLNKQSRKNLQLLQGLKQTCLVIPRMVLRELDTLKQHGSLFRRKTEACLVLEWIEQCMVEKTWIHVQSSAEDRRLTALTPPASPQTPFSSGSGWSCHETRSSLPFLQRRSMVEIVSPTTEDHILECALTCRKVNSDRQVVLLSDDLTLKIESMAEGLICETAQEFRESLINPFSERFLWADSSPRGQTWSVEDDVVLREKYDRCALKRQLKGESAKGLKLILLHNSHYGHHRTLIS